MIPEMPTTAPGLAWETISSANSNNGFRSILATTTSYLFLSAMAPIWYELWLFTATSVVPSMEGRHVLSGTRTNFNLSGPMLLTAALWLADVIAWGSISTPTDKAAPNCILSQLINIWEKVGIAWKRVKTLLVLTSTMNWEERVKFSHILNKNTIYIRCQIISKYLHTMRLYFLLNQDLLP